MPPVVGMSLDREELLARTDQKRPRAGDLETPRRVAVVDPLVDVHALSLGHLRAALVSLSAGPGEAAHLALAAAGRTETQEDPVLRYANVIVYLGTGAVGKTAGPGARRTG